MEGGSMEVNGAGSSSRPGSACCRRMRNPISPRRRSRPCSPHTWAHRDVLWLDTGLEGDHTDGHIDTITRFTDAQTIVTVTCEDRADANYEHDDVNLERLRGFTDADGQSSGSSSCRCRGRASEFAGHRLPLTYANFYIVERRRDRAGLRRHERRACARDSAAAVSRARGRAP